jgi:hypothetical protein
MSYNKPTPHNRTQLSVSKSSTHPTQFRQIKIVDERLRHLCDDILPKYPYLLSVPSDVPYRHGSRFVNSWYRGTPFSLEEEQLQYMSFLSYQEEDTSLLKAEGGWADEEGNIMPEDASPQETGTNGGSTPIAGMQRKKITLNDYKNKGKGASDADDTAPMEREAESAKMKDINDRNPKAPVTGQKNVGSAQGGDSSNIRKRSHDDAFAESTVRLPAKPKLPSPYHIKQTSNAEVSSKGEPQDPPSPEIPQLLSPTLPPAIEDFLKEEGDKPASNGNVESRTDSVRSIPATAGSNPGGKSDNNRGHHRSQSQLSTTSALSEGTISSVRPKPRLTSPQVTTPNRVGSRPATPQANGARSSPGPRQRHTITLKYGKKNRKLVEALLKLSFRNKKPAGKNAYEQTVAPEQSRARSESKSSVLPTKKHPLPESSPESATKHQKYLNAARDDSNEPKTPVPTAKSPVVSNSLQPKAVLVTPKKEVKSSAMRRVGSMDGADACTPVSGQARQSTPVSVERPTTVPRSVAPTSAPAGRDEERRAWRNVNQKFYELGRTIKKEATSMGTSPTDNPNNKESALSVVLLIEALLCFMINMAASALLHPGPDPGWRTILPYHIFVFKASRKFPHLHGLVVQLGAVCRQVIHKFDMERLAREPLPEEQNTAAPTPGSDGNTKTSEDIEKHRKKYHDFRNDLISNANELQVAWLDGSRILSPETIRREYTQTWEKRATDSRLRGTEKVAPDDLKGHFFLPLDVSTPPIEASRFATFLLHEWTTKEDVKWKPRIEL